MPVLLACGFTPLHLQNYLAAFLQKSHPERKVKIEVGLFGDLPGTVEKFVSEGTGVCALAIEWSDLDPRLGYRQTGGWGQRVVPGILENVQARLAQLEGLIGRLASSAKLVVSLPTLDLPPAFHTTSWQASEAEIAFVQMAYAFAGRVVAHPSVSVVNPQRLAVSSPAPGRYDFRADLNTGFPYTQAHAVALGAAFAELITTSTPKKGLITDLDDTFWHGLVGEIGAAEVSWDLGSHSQVHGLYQQTLRALAEQGVLVAIASKNSPAVVEEALKRSDLVMDRDKIFPVEVHWEPKSGSVTRILKTWNIGADSVVFVDDSPMELAEVQAAHPGIECLQFSAADYPSSLALLQRLRDLFGKPRLSEEDSYRLQSIRQGAAFAEQSQAGSNSDLLASAGAVLTLDFAVDATDKRSLELVNKTNQFNLNGRRYSEIEWAESLGQPGSFLAAVSYEDKFGPLGKIGVVKGRMEAGVAVVDTWVLSCRAFSRQIEYQTLAQLFAQKEAEQIRFEYASTPKNQPVSDFLASVAGEAPGEKTVLTKQRFEDACPKMFHEVRVNL